MVERLLTDLADIDPSRLRILAFDWSVLRIIAQQAPELRRICLTEPKTVAARDLWWGPDFDELTLPEAVAASGASGWAAHHATLTEPEISAAKALGLEVFAWTVNDLAAFHRLQPAYRRHNHRLPVLFSVVLAARKHSTCIDAQQ